MSDSRELRRATARALARDGIDGITLEGIAEEAGLAKQALTAIYPTVKDALRRVAAGYYEDVRERAEVVSEARDGSDAMTRFVRANVANALEDLHGFRAAHMTRQVVGNERSGLDQAYIDAEIVPRVNACLDTLERKLSEDQGPTELAGGIHPRRLAFVTYMLSAGMSMIMGLVRSTSGSFKHREEDMLREATMAIGAATSTVRQMAAINDAARRLAQLRTEKDLFDIAPQLLSDALDFDDAEISLDVATMSSLARRAFETGITAHEERDGLSHMATPLRYEGEVRSVLSGKTHRSLGERDVARIETLAAMLGLAHENVHLYENLQALVDERTRELRDAQAALVQSERMNASATLVAGLAHEINTPMGSMIASTSTIASAVDKLEGASPERRDRMLRAMRSAAETAKQSAERVSGILDKLMRFSRLDASERALVDLGESLRDAAAIVQGDCRFDIEAHALPPVSCEPAQLNQVFLQLFTNAVQASATRVMVSAAQDGDSVEIRIVDDGDGVPGAIAHKVFDPGFTTRGVGVGAGMGLAIAQRVMRAHDGTIAMAGTDAGTEVTLRIPIGNPSAG